MSSITPPRDSRADREEPSSISGNAKGLTYRARWTGWVLLDAGCQSDISDDKSQSVACLAYLPKHCIMGVNTVDVRGANDP